MLANSPFLIVSSINIPPLPDWFACRYYRSILNPVKQYRLSGVTPLDWNPCWSIRILERSCANKKILQCASRGGYHQVKSLDHRGAFRSNNRLCGNLRVIQSWHYTVIYHRRHNWLEGESLWFSRLMVGLSHPQGGIRPWVFLTGIDYGKTRPPKKLKLFFSYITHSGNPLGLLPAFSLHLRRHT